MKLLTAEDAANRAKVAEPDKVKLQYLLDSADAHVSYASRYGEFQTKYTVKAEDLYMIDNLMESLKARGFKVANDKGMVVISWEK